MQMRVALPADAEAIAALHAASWRTAYADFFDAAWLANRVAADRLAVWQARMAAPRPGEQVVLAEAGDGLAGFVCVITAADPQWGSHVDNLHVAAAWQGRGLGRQLLAVAARLAMAAAPGSGLDLLVYRQNIGARAFYARLGGADVGSFAETAPDGREAWVHRIWWGDPAILVETM